MTNRRKFLQAATALSAVPLVGRAVFAVGRESVALDAVIFDQRYSEARKFASRAGKLGATIRGFEADITDLWQHELLNRWRTAPSAVAGLTERPALFLLERLAWDHGMRVVFEAEHEPDSRGDASHRVIRSANAGILSELESAGSNWPGVLADTMIASPNAAIRDFSPTDAALAASLDEPAKLYSWIIAPRMAV